MNSRSVALIALFAALAIILNTIRIPTIYWPNMIYLLADIPVVAAFLRYGFKIGIITEAVHVLGQIMLFPMGPAGFVAYPMGLLINLLMFFGIQLASRFISGKVASKNQFSDRKKIFILTGFAMAIRTGIMPVIDYAVFYGILLPLVLSVSFPQAYIAALVPSFILYHVTTTLYVVPLAYIIAKKTSNYLKIKPYVPILN